MKNNINGIDVSEEIRYCNNCSNLGLDFKARKFYCSLSHRPDELPEVLSCDEFSTNSYIKRLQEENKSLQMLSCANCGEKYLSPDGAELYDKNVQLQKENEELKARFNELYNNAEQLANKYNKYGGNKENELVDIINKTTDERNKYKQALREIKNITEKLITEQPEYHSCYYKDECGDNCTPKQQGKVEFCCYENVDKILTIIIEVLNDRD